MRSDKKTYLGFIHDTKTVKVIDDSSITLKFRWKGFCTGDSITLAGKTYIIERPNDILDWGNYMNELFTKWSDRGFQIKSVFYPSRSLFSIKISK